MQCKRSKRGRKAASSSFCLSLLPSRRPASSSVKCNRRWNPMSCTFRSSYSILRHKCSSRGNSSFFGMFWLCQAGCQRVPTLNFHINKLVWQAGQANCSCYVNTKRWQFTWLAGHKQRRVPGDELRRTLPSTIIYKTSLSTPYNLLAVKQLTYLQHGNIPCVDTYLRTTLKRSRNALIANYSV